MGQGLPQKINEPNAETIEALRESREEKLKSYETLNEFWKAMGVDPNDRTFRFSFRAF